MHAASQRSSACSALFTRCAAFQINPHRLHTNSQSALKSAPRYRLVQITFACLLIDSPIALADSVSTFLGKTGHGNFEMTGHGPETDGHDGLKFAAMELQRPGCHLLASPTTHGNRSLRFYAEPWAGCFPSVKRRIHSNVL
jgi:hypothetical protein